MAKCTRGWISANDRNVLERLLKSRVEEQSAGRGHFVHFSAPLSRERVDCCVWIVVNHIGMAPSYRLNSIATSNGSATTSVALVRAVQGRRIDGRPTNREYRHVPTGTLAWLAQRLGKVFTSPRLGTGSCMVGLKNSGSKEAFLIASAINRRPYDRSYMPAQKEASI
jgi:hypothetical protein